MNIPAKATSLVFPYEGTEPLRLDKFLVTCLPDFSRARLQVLIKDGVVQVDGVPAHKSGQLLIKPGTRVEVFIPPPRPSDMPPQDIPLAIIFENTDVLVVDKPAGMVVHPAAGHADGTLVNAALAHAPEMEGVGGVQRPGVVHRLDKDTSGLILLAKNDRAHRWLQAQFKDRVAHKVYLALVDDHPPTPEGRVEIAIGRDPAHRQRMAALPDSKGRPAVSEYRTLERFAEHALLEVHPLTGRTHQIRVHLAFIGCPVAGDVVYGRRKATIPLDRHFLHAHRLAIRLPGEEAERLFESPLPAELSQVLADLRR